MQVRMRNETTLVVTPESVAELMASRYLVNGDVSIEVPKPFESNTEVLTIEARKEVDNG